MNKKIRWTEEELAIIRSRIKKGKNPYQIKLKGRSIIAIRNKCIRLKIWKPKRRIIKAWTMPEIQKLKMFVQTYNYTSTILFERNFFPGRSKDSIAQQMRRMRIKRKI